MSGTGTQSAKKENQGFRTGEGGLDEVFATFDEETTETTEEETEVEQEAESQEETETLEEEETTETEAPEETEETEVEAGPFDHLSEEHQKVVQYMPKEMRELLENADEDMQVQLAEHHKKQDRAFQKKMMGLGEDATLGTQITELLEASGMKPQLTKAGANPVQYFGQLLQHDTALRSGNHKAVVESLGQIYGFDPVKLFSGEEGYKDPTAEGLKRLEQKFDQNTQNAQHDKVASAQAEVNNFASEEDSKGNLLRPNFKKFSPQVLDYMKSEGELDLQKAYDAVMKDLGIGITQPSTEKTTRKTTRVAIKDKKKAASGIESSTTTAEKPEPTTQRDELAKQLGLT